MASFFTPALRKTLVTRMAENPIGTAIAGIAGVGALEAIARPISQEAKIILSRRKLDEYSPNLKDVPKKEIDDYFSVVKTFSPKAAANPVVAASLVNKMVQFGGVDHKLVQDLAKINKDSSYREDNLRAVKNGIADIGGAGILDV